MSQYLLLAILSLGACANAAAQQTVIREVPARMTKSIEGLDLYREYCAVCHGVSGKGDGPAASATKKHPTDLTHLTRTHGGKFPTLAVQTSIKGNNSIVEHGTGEMPVWGSILNQSGAQKALGDMRVTALVKYVESLQDK
jgi:mono/diheme cytochrome c family protein